MNRSRPSPEPRRAPAPTRVWLLGVAVLVCIRLLGGIVPIADAQAWSWITRISEAWLVIGVAVLALRRVPWKEVRADVGRVRLGAVAALACLMALGQFAAAGIDTDPFVEWDMYTGRTNQATYARVEVVAPGGDLSHLPLRGDTGVSREPRAVTGRLLELAREAESGDREAAEVLRGAVETLVARSGMAAEEIRILDCAVADPRAEPPADCRTVHVVALGNGT